MALYLLKRRVLVFMLVVFISGFWGSGQTAGKLVKAFKNYNISGYFSVLFKTCII